MIMMFVIFQQGFEIKSFVTPLAENYLYLANSYIEVTYVVIEQPWRCNRVEQNLFRNGERVWYSVRIVGRK